jgi:Kef-type K+ transport system membrane component KefB/nucleotide-binding universal stress UspA family protein
VTPFHPDPFLFAVAAAGHGEQRVIIFFVQVLLLIAVGRLLSELMQRIGQPAVIGQLLAGIILGPSVFGAIWPAAQQAIFPLNSSDRQMLNAVSELGVLLLLLLTGMETDLALVKRVRRSATITSAAGIVIPFACGYLLGEMLPESVLPDPNRRLLTSLFLATALSISSVKIVAAVLREVDYLRRNLGQVILAAAILDDTIGWTILAFIGGLAAQGRIVIGPLLFSVLGTAAFLVFCFTIGRRWVARIIRWTNDHLVIEMPVITVILVIMIALALLTDFIGVHTVLGAFVAGIMIGQSPILTKHIEEQLRGLIVALFMPIFFGVAGLAIDLKVLGDPHLLGLAVLLIVIASIGKLGGCYLGSRLARLNHPEALAVGFAMNARGSTEVILATIGLAMGVLNQQLFTIIVLMAVVTTLCMPPLLRWALARVPMRDEEKARLEKEVEEEKDSVPKLERILVGLDRSENGKLASRLAGWLIGARRLTATVMDVGSATEGSGPTSLPSQDVVESAETAAQNVEARDKSGAADIKRDERDPIDAAAQEAKADQTPVRELISILPLKAQTDTAGDARAEAILTEARNGYGLLFLGLGARSRATTQNFPSEIQKIVREFPGPIAIALHREIRNAPSDTPLERILVPTTGADYSRFGAEVAVAIAKGCGATITALNISASPAENELLRRPNQLLRTGRALLGDIVALGEREGVRVMSKAFVGPTKEGVILRQATLGRYQLIVLGTKARSVDQIHFGQSATALLENASCSILILKS